MNTHPVPSTERASVTERLWRGVARTCAAEAGVGAYLVVAMIAGAWIAVLVVLGALIAAEAWRHHHHHHRRYYHHHHHHRPKPAPKGARPWRPSKGLVGLVFGAVIVRRDGIARPLLWTVVGAVVALVIAYVAVGLVLDAAGGMALIVGAVAAGGVALARSQVDRTGDRGDRGDRGDKDEQLRAHPGTMINEGGQQ